MSSIGNRVRVWLSALRGSELGKIVLHNLVFDWLHNRLNKDFVSSFLVAAAHCWKQTSDPCDCIREVADAIPDRFLCKGPPSRKAETHSRVLDARDLVRYNTRQGKIGEWISDSVARQTIEQLSRPGALDGVACGFMETRRGFAWVTQTSCIDRARDGARALTSEAERRRGAAVTVRDGLGLMHYVNNDLVEVVYPKGVVEQTDFAAPTFIEGAPGLVYRSAAGEDGWGLALDLRTNGAGFPEAVHRSIPFTSEFKVRMVGTLRAVGWNFEWDAERAPDDEPLTTIVTEIDARDQATARRAVKLIDTAVELYGAPAADVRSFRDDLVAYAGEPATGSRPPFARDTTAQALREMALDFADDGLERAAREAAAALQTYFDAHPVTP